MLISTHPRGIKRAASSNSRGECCKSPLVSRNRRFSRLISCLSLSSRCNLGFRCQQPFTRQHLIGQAKQREELLGVLVQPAIAGLAMAEQVLHHMEGMLNLGPNARFGLFDPLHPFTPRVLRQGLAFAWPKRDMPGHRKRLVLFPLLYPLVPASPNTSVSSPCTSPALR